MILTGYIRKLESESKWKEALAEWKSIRSLHDGKEWIDLQISAVQLIIDSISRGDAQRERTQRRIENMCSTLFERALSIDYVNDLRLVEKILKEEGWRKNDYSEVDLLLATEKYPSYFYEHAN